MPATISPLTRLYLILYNLLSFSLWATCTVRTALLFLSHDAPFRHVYPLLKTTQSLATLEVVHSLLGIVRAPVVTTAMQVASRLLLVWGVMYPFGGEIVGTASGEEIGDYAFLGCLSAWGITECIRYGFFALQVSGIKVPGWWMWLRYNTFYVLYPVGITSECVLVFKALGPAADLNPMYWWFFVVVLAVYVPGMWPISASDVSNLPGSYILYTHMIAQRRKVMQKSRTD